MLDVLLENALLLNCSRNIIIYLKVLEVYTTIHIISSILLWKSGNTNLPLFPSSSFLLLFSLLFSFSHSFSTVTLCQGKERKGKQEEEEGRKKEREAKKGRKLSEKRGRGDGDNSRKKGRKQGGTVDSNEPNIL